MLAGGSLLAHQGGWDEALMILTPVGIFATLIWIAHKREADEGDGNGPSPT